MKCRWMPKNNRRMISKTQISEYTGRMLFLNFQPLTSLSGTFIVFLLCCAKGIEIAFSSSALICADSHHLSENERWERNRKIKFPTRWQRDTFVAFSVQHKNRREKPRQLWAAEEWIYINIYIHIYTYFCRFCPWVRNWLKMIRNHRVWKG